MIITMTSLFTGKKNQMDLDVTPDQLDRWQEGELIQKIFPHLSIDEREFLITRVSIDEQAQFFVGEEK